mmetsp:Transcript_29312/g.75541  ORF Transcript_29312/g.75541 Transcript_29312/m.75541 type:complete len:1005 (-) Transcript_29312:36-3050(-)
MAGRISEEEFEEFDEKVDAISRALNALKSEGVDSKKAKELEEEALAKAAEVERRKEEKAKKEEERRRQEEIERKRKKLGFVGKFCFRCKKERGVEENKCSVCGGPLMSEEERKKDLDAKVSVMKTEVQARQAKLEKWRKWREEDPEGFQRAAGRLADGSSGKKTQEYWNNFIDEEEEQEFWESLPVTDPTPEMKAMEKDIEERGRIRREKREKAEALKEKGNGAFKEGKYTTAIEYYTDGIKESRDYKVLYTNRAQCYLKLKKWEEAEKDCGEVLNIADLFEGGANGPVCVKALVRRATARRKMGKLEDALKDLQDAQKIEPKNSVIKNDMDAVEVELAEKNRVEMVRAMMRASAKKEGEKKGDASSTSTTSKIEEGEEGGAKFEVIDDEEKVDEKGGEEGEDKEVPSTVKESLTAIAKACAELKKVLPSRLPVPGEEEEEKYTVAGIAKNAEKLRGVFQNVGLHLVDDESRIYYRECGALRRSLVYLCILAGQEAEGEDTKMKGVKQGYKSDKNVLASFVAMLVMAFLNDVNKEEVLGDSRLPAIVALRHLCEGWESDIGAYSALCQLVELLAQHKRVRPALLKQRFFERAVSHFASSKPQPGSSLTFPTLPPSSLVSVCHYLSDFLAEKGGQDAMKKLVTSPVKSGQFLPACISLLRSPYPPVREAGTQLVSAILAVGVEVVTPMLEKRENAPVFLSSLLALLLPNKPASQQNDAAEWEKIAQLAELDMDGSGGKDAKFELAWTGEEVASHALSCLVHLAGAGKEVQAQLVSFGSVKILLPYVKGATTTSAYKAAIAGQSKKKGGKKEGKVMLSPLLSLKTLTCVGRLVTNDDALKMVWAESDIVDVVWPFVSSSVVEEVDAGVRVVAALTTRAPPIVRAIAGRGGAIEAMQRVLKPVQNEEGDGSRKVGDAVIYSDTTSFSNAAGNAALFFAAAAREDSLLPSLRDTKGLVLDLLHLAHKGSGGGQKNAGIALARMARDPAMLAVLRANHGIEILRSYVQA